MRWSRVRARIGGDSIEFGVDGWQKATLSGSWSVPSGYVSCGWFQDPFGIVHLRGYVTGGSGTILSLPVGYRPEAIEVFGNVTVTSAGVVSASSSPASLSGITFRPGV